MDSQHVSPGIQPCACSLQASPLKPLRALPAHQKHIASQQRLFKNSLHLESGQNHGTSGDFMMNGVDFPQALFFVPFLQLGCWKGWWTIQQLKNLQWNWKICVVFDLFFPITLMTSSFCNSNQLVVSLVQPELFDYEMVTKSNQWWIGGECWWAYSRHLPSMVLQSFDQKFPNSLLFRVNRKS